MAYLIDTNILVRLANLVDPQFVEADRAVSELRRRGETLHLTAQNLIEFRNVATRPSAANGMGLSVHEAESKPAVFEAAFSLLVETADIFSAWKALVSGAGVIGKQVHDARLVAVCHVHKVTHLLTVDVAHFKKLAGHAPGVIVVDPANV